MKLRLLGKGDIGISSIVQLTVQKIDHFLFFVSRMFTWITSKVSSRSNRFLVPRVRRCKVNLPAKIVRDDIHPITKAEKKLRPSEWPDIVDMRLKKKRRPSSTH